MKDRKPALLRSILQPFPVRQSLGCPSLGLCDWIAARYDLPQARRGGFPLLVLRRPRQAEIHLHSHILHKIAQPFGLRSIFVRLCLGLPQPDSLEGAPQAVGWRKALRTRNGRLGADEPFRAAFRGALRSASRQSQRLSRAKPASRLFSALHLPKRWLSIMKGLLQSAFAQILSAERISQSTFEQVVPARGAGNGLVKRLAFRLACRRPALVLAAAQGRRSDPARLEPSEAAFSQSVNASSAPLPSSASLRLSVRSPREGGELWKLLQDWTTRLSSPARGSWAFPATDASHPLFWGPPWQEWILHWRGADASASCLDLPSEARRALALPPQLRRCWQSGGPRGAACLPAANGSLGRQRVEKVARALPPHPGRQPVQLMLARSQQALSQQALTALQSRGAQAGLAPPVAQAPAAPPDVDLQQLTYQVSDELERRIRTERERRGL